MPTFSPRLCRLSAARMIPVRTSSIVTPGPLCGFRRRTMGARTIGPAVGARAPLAHLRQAASSWSRSFPSTSEKSNAGAGVRSSTGFDSGFGSNLLCVCCDKRLALLATNSFSFRALASPPILPADLRRAVFSEALSNSSLSLSFTYRPRRTLKNSLRTGRTTRSNISSVARSRRISQASSCGSVPPGHVQARRRRRP